MPIYLGEEKRVAVESVRREKPVRARSAWQYFEQDQGERDKVRKNNPGIRRAELVKKLGEQWKSLSDEQKEPYKARAKADKERYAVEYALYDREQCLAEIQALADKAREADEEEIWAAQAAGGVDENSGMDEDEEADHGKAEDEEALTPTEVRQGEENFWGLWADYEAEDDDDEDDRTPTDFVLASSYASAGDRVQWSYHDRLGRESLD